MMPALPIRASTRERRDLVGDATRLCRRLTGSGC